MTSSGSKVEALLGPRAPPRALKDTRKSAPTWKLSLICTGEVSVGHRPPAPEGLTWQAAQLKPFLAE